MERLVRRVTDEIQTFFTFVIAKDFALNVCRLR
jgi:hypothetical protein